MTITGLFTLPYLGILLDYIIKLKELQDCKCSENWIREYGYYFTIIYFSLITLIIFISILSVILCMF